MKLLLILSALISLFLCNDTETSSSEAKYITLVEGDNELKLNLSEINDIQVGNCEGGCIVHDIQISTLSCQTKDGEQQHMYVHVKLQKNIVKSEHSGEWICTFDLQHVVDGRRETIPYEQRFFAIVSSEAAKQKEPLEPWMIVAIAVGGSVIIVIILGQTGCILYFKAKAKRAEIAKNLTPNKNSEDLDSSARERYVNKEKELSDSNADEIYESLEAVRVPIPPSIETIPVTPKPRNPKPPNKPCPASHNDFEPRSDPGHSNTEPRPQPKNPMASGGLNSASSLGRIQKRPRQPLPTEEIYEEMIPEASPELMKSSGPSFGGRRPRELPQTPRPPYSPGVVPKQPIGPPGQRMPTPGLGQHGMVQSGHPMPGHVRPPIRQPQMPGPGRPLPGFMGPMGPTGPMRPMGPISPPGPRGPMNILPSMISGAVLKPVPMNKQGPRTPVGLRRMVHEPSVLSITPAQSISNLARRPVPVPQLKPKPPVPLPVQHKLQPEEPSQEPGLYYGSSDEEFEAYEPLPEYRIYGNAPPKKFTRNE